MEIYKSKMTIQGSLIGQNSVLPALKNIEDHLTVASSKNLLKRTPGLGNYANHRVLPYKIQNQYDQKHKQIVMNTIIYENEHLKATFLPELGGRLYSLFNKKHKRDLLYVNPIFQAANLGIRNAWFSGGIEWNVGKFGHSCLSCEPVHFAICINDQKEKFLRMYEYERMKKIFYQIDFFLPKNSDQLTSYVRIINPYAEKTQLYYWTNIAVDEKNNVRVFSEEKEVIYMNAKLDHNGDTILNFNEGKLPTLENIAGDVSYPESLLRSCEYFYQNKKTLRFPWEAAGYDDGFVFYEYSTQPLNYRKMFCWGRHRGGDKWQSHLNGGRKEKYFEIQAGLFPTQLHSEKMPGNTEQHFMQVFGSLFVDDVKAMYGPLDDSTNYVKRNVFDKNNAQNTKQIHSLLKLQSKLPIHDILSVGRGWAYVDCAQNPKLHSTLHTMHFSIDGLNDEQTFWIHLINCFTDDEKKVQKMPKMDLNFSPLSYMIDVSWEKYLIPALKHDHKNKLWYSFHLGILYYENKKIDKSLAVLTSLVNKDTPPILLYTIAAIYDKLSDTKSALQYYDWAYKNLKQSMYKNFKEDFLCEYFKFLYKTKKYTKLWTCYKNSKIVSEEIQVILAQCAFELKKWKELNTFFKLKLAKIKEGDNTLCELWFKRKAYELKNKNLDNIRKTYVPPRNIDFRML